MRGLEVGVDGEGVLTHEDVFDGGDVVALVEEEHGLFVVEGIHAAVGEGAVAVRHEHSIGCYSGNTLVAVLECLDIGEKHQRE